MLSNIDVQNNLFYSNLINTMERSEAKWKEVCRGEQVYGYLNYNNGLCH